jgi:hypothetical protein
MEGFPEDDDRALNTHLIRVLYIGTTPLDAASTFKMQKNTENKCLQQHQPYSCQRLSSYRGSQSKSFILIRDKQHSSFSVFREHPRHTSE